MAKPGIDLTRTTATATYGGAITYDSGYYYDQSGFHYDRWVTDTLDPTQGEIPRMSVSAEKVKLGSRQEDVKIKEIEEL